MSIMFVGGQILFVGGQIAMDEACCCAAPLGCCEGLSDNLTLTISNSLCANLANQAIALTWDSFNNRWAGTGSTTNDCTFTFHLSCSGDLWILLIDSVGCMTSLGSGGSCSPFEVTGQGTFSFGAAECCQDCAGDTFDWSVTEA